MRNGGKEIVGEVIANVFLLVYRGVARRLMAALEEHARSLGRSTLVLDTETGSGAEKMYEKLGWVKVGVIPEISWTPDQTRCAPTTFFYKLLE